MRLPGQFQVYYNFFYENISSAQKRVISKNQLTKQKQANTKEQIQQFSRTQKLLRGRKSFALRFGTFFVFKIFS